ncbi:MAG TPA: NAD-dependent epimerase/dehydratase family protein [Candidatus Limnocylindrales bacterium]|nr:NAD-dependent epimerase/dehydratase family protein [Candidatus Limnocylindrales bacterium]
MDIVVSGATGFIGYNLVQHLSQQGFKISGLIRNFHKVDLLTQWGVEPVLVDLQDTDKLKEAVRGAKVVFHLAALRGEGFWSWEEFYRVNVKGTENLLKACLNQVNHFIYCSSVSVFGHFWPGPATENYPYAPVNNYGRSKVEAEKLVFRYYQEKDLPVTIVRPVITYGPQDVSGMLTKLIRLIYSGKYLTVGNGNNRVHLVYIDDLIQGFERIMTQPRAVGEAFIIAGEKPITVNELVAKVAFILNKKVPPFHVPRSLARGIGFCLEKIFAAGASTRLSFFKKEPLCTRSKVDIMTVDCSYSIEKARQLLGYQPRVPYDEGIRWTVEWLRTGRQL